MEGPETEPDLGSIDKVDALDELRRLSPLLKSTVDFPKMAFGCRPPPRASYLLGAL